MKISLATFAAIGIFAVGAWAAEPELSLLFTSQGKTAESISTVPVWSTSTCGPQPGHLATRADVS